MTNETPPHVTPHGEPRKPATRRLPGIDDAALAGSGRASRLIGSKVYKGDTSIGKIEDVLVDLDHGRLTAFILSLGGGFLGFGDNLVAVPANQIMAGSEGNFMTDLTEAQLTSAPDFDFKSIGQRFPRG
jgi:sporulation protein YlmC with PRC-barrel domain